MGTPKVMHKNTASLTKKTLKTLQKRHEKHTVKGMKNAQK